LVFVSRVAWKITAEAPWFLLRQGEATDLPRKTLVFMGSLMDARVGQVYGPRLRKAGLAIVLLWLEEERQIVSMPLPAMGR